MAARTLPWLRRPIQSTARALPAFDIAVRTRMSYDSNTRDYVARRRAEGRSNREIRRCLKRYVCRSVFRQLQACMA